MGQISPACYFIKEGNVDILVRKEDPSESPYLLARLSKGSCFNFVNSFMARPSLFDFVASQSNDDSLHCGSTLLYVLE